MKAVIVEIKDSVAAVLSEDGIVSKIRNKNYSIGQEIIIKNNSKYIKLAASAAAALILFVTPAWAYLTPYSYVSLDINPSFEFSVNRFDRVLEVRAVNGDGEKVVENIGVSELKNKEINEAVKHVLVELKEQGYIIEGEEGGVIIAASSKTQEKTNELASSLKTSIQEEVAVKVLKAEGQDKVEQNKEKTEDKAEKEEQKIVEKAEQPSILNEQSGTEIKEEPDKTREDEKIKESKETKEAVENKEESKEVKEESKEIKEAEKKAAKEEKKVIKEEVKAAKEAKEEKKEDKHKSKFSVEVIEVSQDEVDEAKEYNVTPGKFNLVKKLEEVYPDTLTFNSDEWFDKPVKEIMDAIEEYSKTGKDQKKETKQEKSNKESIETKESDKKSDKNKNSNN
jgi:hypothetical protein